jgi:hypothetical protein
LIYFINGLTSRKSEQLKSRTDFLYYVLSPKRGIAFYLLGNAAGQVPFFLLQAQSTLPIANVFSTIEIITFYRCLHKNELDADQVRFCKKYNKILDVNFALHQASFNFGKKMQLKHDQKRNQKHSTDTVEAFCKLDLITQVRRASEALKRYPELSNSTHQKAEVLLPIHKNSCAKIMVRLLQNPSDVNNFIPNSIPSMLEGIEIIQLNVKDYPKDYYYTKFELTQMPFEDQLCHDVMQVKFSSKLTKLTEKMSDFLKSSLAPALLSQPNIEEIITKNSNIREPRVNENIQSLKNVVFSIGNSDADTTAAELLIKENKRLAKTIKDDYQTIIRSPNFLACKINATKTKVGIDQFRSTLERINTISKSQLIKNHHEQKALAHFFKKRSRWLKLKWDWVRAYDLDSVIQLLRSNTILNAVIISHAKQDGHLVNSQQQEFPTEAFSKLSPALLSLNFYSCYSDKTINLYKIKNELTTNNSFYKIRHASSLKQNDFMDGSSYAPIAAFGDYLFQLDLTLNRSTKGAQLFQKQFQNDFISEPATEMCNADLSGFNIIKGTFAITINDYYLKTVSKDQILVPLEFQFPCSVLKSSGNKLNLKSINNDGGSELDLTHFTEFKIGSYLLNRVHLKFTSPSIAIFKF